MQDPLVDLGGQARLIIAARESKEADSVALCLLLAHVGHLLELLDVAGQGRDGRLQLLVLLLEDGHLGEDSLHLKHRGDEKIQFLITGEVGNGFHF